MAIPPESTGLAEDFVAESFLAYLEPNERRFLLKLGKHRIFLPDEQLFLQGDPSEHAFIILSGWVRVYGMEPTGVEILYALRGPGEILGDEAALQGWARPSSVRTIDRVTAVQLLGAELRAALAERPALAVALALSLQSRLREAEVARVELATLDVGARVATYLLRLADRHGVSGPDGIALRLPLSQQDIASHVGASRRAVARFFALLRAKNVVTSGRRRLVITQPEVLRQIARPG